MIPFSKRLFFRSKHGADKIVRNLKKKHIEAAAIHGNKTQMQRQKTLKAFKNKKLNFNGRYCG